MRTFQRKPIVFSYRGRSVQGQVGDTVGSALYAAGIRIFSRSFQYHRPRGLFCVNGRCVNCAVRVNGRPHVRACAERLEPGMIVEPEGGWPSISFDFWRIVDHLHFFFPPGFQYRYFIRPRWMFRIWENILRNVAAHSVMPSPVGVPAKTAACRREATDVVIVGGGPAGLATALAAGRQGLRVTLIDDDATLGGSLKLDRRAGADGERSSSDLKNVISEVLALENLTVHLNTRCFAYFGNGPVCAFRGNTLIEVTAKAVVIATGAYERPMIFGNNDLPGVFLATGALRLLHLYGVHPGKRMVVAARTDYDIETAAAFLDAGLEIVAVVDERAAGQSASPATWRLRERGVRILEGYEIKHAHGIGRLKAVTIVRGPGTAGQGRDSQKLSCDVLVTCGSLHPANELCFQATSRGEFLLEGAGGWTGLVEGERPTITEDGTLLFAVGNAAFIGDLEKSQHQGRIAGLAAAAEIVGDNTVLAEELRKERELLSTLLEINHTRGARP